MYTKRQNIDKKWAIPRKGTTYVITPSHSKDLGIPVLLALRDMLKIVKTRKEARYAIKNKEILLNSKIVKKESLPIMLFDILSIKPLKKNYRLYISEHGKFKLEETDSKEKICKIVNKKIIKNALVQLCLNDGRTVLTKDKMNVSDSVIFDLVKKTIVKHLPLKKGAEVSVILGKHAGKKGQIIEFKNKMCVVEIAGKKTDMEIKNLMVVKC